MKEKLLKKIISDLGGTGSEILVDTLYEKQNVNEYLIAKKLKTTINKTRNLLYKLADEGLVSFLRKKDKKKGGWYTYFWSLDIKKSFLKFKEKLSMEIEKLQKELKNTLKERHFFCKNCNIQYDEENAMIHEYTCPECGQVLEIKSNEEITAKINSEIKKKEEALKEISEYIEEIERKEQKTKEKRMKAELRRKELERKKRREKAKRERKILEKLKMKVREKKHLKKKVKKKSKKSRKRAKKHLKKRKKKKGKR